MKKTLITVFAMLASFSVLAADLQRVAAPTLSVELGNTELPSGAESTNVRPIASVPVQLPEIQTPQGAPEPAAAILVPSTEVATETADIVVGSQPATITETSATAPKVVTPSGESTGGWVSEWIEVPISALEHLWPSTPPASKPCQRLFVACQADNHICLRFF